MACGDLTDDEWVLVEPFLPLGAPGPIPPLRQYLNGVIWRFRVGSLWRDAPERYGPWSSVYGRFEVWAKQGVFEALRVMILLCLAGYARPLAGRT